MAWNRTPKESRGGGQISIRAGREMENPRAGRGRGKTNAGLILKEISPFGEAQDFTPGEFLRSERPEPPVAEESGGMTENDRVVQEIENPGARGSLQRPSYLYTRSLVSRSGAQDRLCPESPGKWSHPGTRHDLPLISRRLNLRPARPGRFREDFVSTYSFCNLAHASHLIRHWEPRKPWETVPMTSVFSGPVLSP
jgi:hypothetical protein